MREDESSDVFEAGKILVMYSNEAPSPGHVARLRRISGLPVIVINSDEQATAEAPGAVVILGHRYLRQALPTAGRLRWVQSTAGGVDHLLSDRLEEAAPVVSRCPIFSDVVAWHALTLGLSTIRRIPNSVTLQRRGVHRRPTEMLPLPRRAMILGLGEIGCELGKLLLGLGLHVVGVARHETDRRRASCDRLVTDASWRSDLQWVDLLFIALPHTSQTRGLVDREVLELLPPHAVLVNVGRTQVVDHETLLERLRDGNLGGAATDVLDPVPDAADPVWETPGFLVTPKSATYVRGRQARLEFFIEDQVSRFARGEPPLHQVALTVPVK